MSNKNLAGRALHLIYRYWQTHDHTYPSSREIAEGLSISVNQWGGVRNQLFETRVLKRSPVWKIQFTPLGLQYLKENDVDESDLPSLVSDQTLKIESEEPVSVGTLVKKFVENFYEIPLLGMVKAGTGDNLRAYGGDETISIPAFDNLPPEEKLTLWQVEGTSMLHEGINPDDYVITEKVSFLEIKDGDMIVTYYLPPDKFEKKTQDEIDLAIQDPGNFSGPTLKYFRRMKKGKTPYYSLSWQNEKDNSEVTIYSRHLDTDRVWRVVAVYAPEKFRLYNKKALRM